MRIALISDIHGNLHALDVVLEDINKSNVDQIICLGDLSSLGPQPREVIERLQELQIPTIMGNHDLYLLKPELTENHHPWLRSTELWCRAQLTQDNLDFLNSLQASLSLMLDENTTALCFHGSPRSNEEFLYPTTPAETLDEALAGQPARVLIGGHTHVQMIRPHRGTLMVNPGSVGMPFEFPARGQGQHALRWAEYAVLEMSNGKLTTHLHRLPIDFEYLTKIARASGIPDVEFWLSTWYVE